MSDKDPYAELLRLCAQGDEKAFSSLYQQTTGKLFAVSLRIMQTRQSAEEVLQEGYIKIWEKAGTFDSGKARAMTWMTTIIRNRALDVLRSYKSRPVEVEAQFEGMDFAAVESGPDKLAGISLETRQVLECLNELKEKQRQSVLMAYYYGQTHEEISRKLEAPLGTVKAWVRRGVERLRKCLE